MAELIRNLTISSSKSLIYALALVGAFAFAAYGQNAPSVAFDYMIQDVCLGSDGQVLQITPLDPSCTRQRDLQLGELLPYHKDDWPSRKQWLQMPDGLQRGDSIPISVKGLGTAAFQTFDWGNGVRKFGVYDGPNGDGGSLVAIGNGLVGSIMTIDQTGGVQMFVDGKHCHGAVNMDSLLVGWPFAPADLSSQPSGESHDLIRRVRHFGEPCPTRYAHPTTAWYFIDFAPMNAPGSVGHHVLKALVSEHYSGTNLDRSPNMERMYFSRELGRMRWERWQNFSQKVRPGDRRLAARLAAGGRCVGGVGAPHLPGDWIMVRCHEWTNLVPPQHKGGDSVEPWLKALESATNAAPLLSLSAP